MNRMRWHILSVLLLTGMLSSCKSRKDVQGDRHVPGRKTEEVLSMLEEQEIDCDWLSIKYDVEIKTSKVEDSFKMYVRLKQDSVIWISATYYAVEVARFLFTPDTVMFMDRKNNQYYVGGYQYIKDRFDVEASYEILESLILSNSAKLLQMEGDGEKMRVSKDEGKYFLSVMKKGQLRRALKRDDPDGGVDDGTNLSISLWVNPDDFRLSRTAIADFDSDRLLTADYSDHRETCNSTLPYVTVFTVDSENEQAKVKTSVMRVSFGKEVSLSFTIPEKYEALVP